MKSIVEFRDTLYSLSLRNCFNPYLDVCPIFDRVDAVQIRRQNLEALFDAAGSAEVIDLWVGRDLGYRGGRRTGLALADEFSLEFFGEKCGAKKLMKSTIGPVQKERTATVIREALEWVDVPVLTWNVFPVHPFKPGIPFSNRYHSKSEFKIGMGFLSFICKNFRIRNAIGIGGDAYSGLTALIPNSLHARHPSYGGQSEFLTQMKRIYLGASQSVARQGELAV